MFTPQLYNNILDQEFIQKIDINSITVAGDFLSQQVLANHFLTNSEEVPLYNEYGPTENSVCSSVSKISFPGTIISIGTPIWNTSLYVLDAHGQRVPIGVAGELYIGGAGVARGYLNRPELTSERFITNPFSNDSSDRLYRTGDLVKYLPDGNLVFLGRIDQQVKLRGFRIELGEVANALSGYEQVQDAVVTLHENEHLVGYVALGDEFGSLREGFVLDILEHVKKELPDYMVPSFIVPMDRLPLTPNGKVDRKALPSPDVSKMQLEYVAPYTETQKQLAAIWSELLGVEKIGVHDNFFHLGGHSLLATRLMGKVRQVLGVEIPLKVMFEHPSILTLSEQISNAGASYLPSIVPMPETTELVPSFGQQRLWFIDRLEPGDPKYNMPGGLRLKGELDIKKLEKSISHILERHEVLRTVYHQTSEDTLLQLLPTVSFDIQTDDLSLLSQEDQEKNIIVRLEEEVGKGFDLSKDLMLRARLIRLSDKSHVLLFCMHHIASDGWSMGILIKYFPLNNL